MPATRGLIAAPWTPASRLLCSGKENEASFESSHGLTQNRAPRFHLNLVPRHGGQDPKVDNAWPAALDEDEPSEIAVAGDKDSTLLVSDAQQLGVLGPRVVQQ